MHPDNVKLGPGTVYIAGTEFHGAVSDYNYDDYREAAHDYIKDKIVLDSSSASFTCTCQINRIALLKVVGIWNWVRENCPNSRVRHLMKYGKNDRVRWKNYKRAVHMIGKMVKEV